MQLKIDKIEFFQTCVGGCWTFLIMQEIHWQILISKAYDINERLDIDDRLSNMQGNTTWVLQLLPQQILGIVGRNVISNGGSLSPMSLTV